MGVQLPSPAPSTPSLRAGRRPPASEAPYRGRGWREGDRGPARSLGGPLAERDTRGAQASVPLDGVGVRVPQGPPLQRAVSPRTKCRRTTKSRRRRSSNSRTPGCGPGNAGAAPARRPKPPYGKTVTVLLSAREEWPVLTREGTPELPWEDLPGARVGVRTPPRVVAAYWGGRSPRQDPPPQERS